MDRKVIFAKCLLGLIGMGLNVWPALAEPVSAPLRQFTPAELRADFTAMYKGLQSAAHDLYAFTPKAELDRAYRDALARLNKPMTMLKAQIIQASSWNPARTIA
jgi:hypothetical protein